MTVFRRTIYLICGLLLVGSNTAFSIDDGGADDLLLLIPSLIAKRNFSNQKPGPANTGPTGKLAQFTGSIDVNTDGRVIENLDITGCVQVKARNVIIRNVRIDCSSFYAIRVYDEARNLLIEDVEMLNMQSAGVLGSNFTLKRANIHDSGGDAVKPTSNVLIESSWFHRLGTKAGSHSDGVQMTSGGNVVVRANTIDMPPLSGYTNSQCLIIQTNFGPIDTVIIEDNWLNGGGWCVQINDKGQGFGSPTNVTVKNNQFGGDCQFGTILVRGDEPDTQIQGNVFLPTGGIITADVPISTCSNDL